MRVQELNFSQEVDPHIWDACKKIFVYANCELPGEIQIFLMFRTKVFSDIKQPICQITNNVLAIFLCDFVCLWFSFLNRAWVPLWEIPFWSVFDIVNYCSWLYTGWLEKMLMLSQVFQHTKTRETGSLQQMKNTVSLWCACVHTSEYYAQVESKQKSPDP